MILLSKLGALKPLCNTNKNAIISIRHYVQLKPCFVITVPRTIQNVPSRSQSIFKFFKRATEADFKIKDKIPPPYALIYRNTMDRYLFSAQILSAACLALVGTLVIISGGASDFKLQIDSWVEQPKALESDIYIYLTALLGMCITLQTMVMRMPLRVYHLPKSKQYTFIYYSNIPLLQRQLKCTQQEISKVPESGILPWRDSRYNVKAAPVIMVENFFRAPADMHVMLGYQKEFEEEE